MWASLVSLLHLPVFCCLFFSGVLFTTAFQSLDKNSSMSLVINLTFFNLFARPLFFRPCPGLGDEAAWVIFVKNSKLGSLTRCPFLESPGNFSGPKSRSKISDLTITKLLYSQILNMKRSSLHTRSFRRKHFSVFRYWWTKNGFTGPKSFRVFRETGAT